jgi:hypothetical protein
MANRTSKTPTKRPSKGQAKHTRRLKQAARKEIGVTTPNISPVQPAKVQKVKDKAKDKDES